MFQFLTFGLVIVVSGIVVFLAFFAHYIFEALREHGQVRQVIDEKDLSEIRSDIEGLSANLLENSEKAEGVVKESEEKSTRLQEQLVAKIKDAEQMLERLEGNAGAEAPPVDEGKLAELKSKVQEIEEDVPSGETEAPEPAAAEEEAPQAAEDVSATVPEQPVAEAQAPAEELDLEKELLSEPAPEASEQAAAEGEEGAGKFQPEKMDEVVALAAAGTDAVEIAQKVGLEPGEVELIINLRGQGGK